MSDNKIRKAMIGLIHDTVPDASITGKVLAVDEANYTCDVDPSDGGPTYFEVRLKVSVDGDDSGLISVPEAGSDVTICNLYSDDNAWYVNKVSKILKWHLKTASGAVITFDQAGVITMNNGSFGGLVIAEQLKNQYDANQQIMVSAIRAACASIDGALNALVAGSGNSTQIFQSAISGLKPLDITLLENSSIKHGKPN